MNDKCEKALCCADCKDNKRCKAYAAWNEKPSYSASKAWMKPNAWKVEPKGWRA
jgi:hypothetical protein